MREMEICKRTPSDPYSSGVALGKDTAVRHQSMNRKSHFGFRCHRTFFDSKTGSIERSVVCQKGNQFRIGFDNQVMPWRRQPCIHQARDDTYASSYFNYAVVWSKESANQLSLSCFILSKHER